MRERPPASMWQTADTSSSMPPAATAGESGAVDEPAVGGSMVGRVAQPTLSNLQGLIDEMRMFMLTCVCDMSLLNLQVSKISTQFALPPTELLASCDLCNQEPMVCRQNRSCSSNVHIAVHLVGIYDMIEAFRENGLNALPNGNLKMSRLELLLSR